jgi:hypothetical protein
VLIVLSVVSVLEFVRGRPRVRAGVAMAMCGILGAWRLHVAGTHHVLDLQALESRFVVTGRYAARALPVNAVVLAVQESGSVRYHGGRTAIAWDGIEPGGLDAAIAWLRSHGRPVFIVLEDAEEPRFRARFSSQRFGRLEWPPRVEINAPVRVHVYAVDDRERYLGGAGVATEHVR